MIAGFLFFEKTLKFPSIRVKKESDSVSVFEVSNYSPNVV
jgi:hypothetical protein